MKHSTRLLLFVWRIIAIFLILSIPAQLALLIWQFVSERYSPESLHEAANLIKAKPTLLAIAYALFSALLVLLYKTSVVRTFVSTRLHLSEQVNVKSLLVSAAAFASFGLLSFVVAHTASVSTWFAFKSIGGVAFLLVGAAATIFWVRRGARA